MTPEIEKKYQRLRSFFFGLCILAAGLFFLITSKNIVKTLSAETWRIYSGVLESGDKARSTTLFRTTWLKYSYEIDGKKYQGTRIGYGISRIDEVQATDKIVKVYVNPEDYSDSVLVTGFKNTHFIGLLFSGGFMWLGFYLWKRTK
ncbi:DUF3592 domain-containing protein [Cellvibrio mixtus]|uniref:DUF3592 domain-containing protein n=1 Tax=Cellvibrio mixtus TaxID=39650 RepID=UPI000586E914|nr:DUF3592 domain-containing protein [Cellvibrio mixtus]